MDPYDRRSVQAVWDRVAPGKQVLAHRATGGKPPRDDIRRAHELLLTLSRGYDSLAAGKRVPILRQLAAQCRRDADRLGLREEATVPSQRALEAELAQTLEGLDTQAAASLRRQLAERVQTLSRMR